VLLFDKAYKGIQEDFENNVVFVKYTKPPNSFLCEELRVANSEMEKIRSLIEHSIGDVKSRFGILKNIFRHSRHAAEQPMMAFFSPSFGHKGPIL
jgi:hypothetical protein